MKNGENVFEYDKNNYIKTVSDIEVLTVSQEEKIEWKNVSELSKHPVNGDLIKVTTESGRSVTTTLSHSHLKKEDGKIKPILGSDLVIGNRIPVIKKSPVIIDYESKIIDEYDVVWLLAEKGILSRVKNKIIVVQNQYIKKLENIMNDTLMKYNYSFEEDFEDSLQDSHIIWDKIIDIEIIKEYENKYVYDFSVPGNETFALFSGIVVHNTLNTFHKAGQGDKTVTTGVPRFQELLNATKSPRMVNCKIFFNKGNSTIQELRETVGHNLVCLTINDLAESLNIHMDKKEEPWYDSFKVLYNDRFSEHSDCVSIKLNKKILFKYRINIHEIADRIEEEWDDLHCVFSPQDVAQIDVFVDMSKIKFSESQLLFVTDENANEIYMDECVVPNLEKFVCFGIPGIQSIYYTKNEVDELYIETDGSNFKKLLGHPIVDMTRLHSNNVWDIYQTLGIEAAKKFLVLEFESIMIGINLCHVKLLVEKMTFTGNISSISRYTLRKDECGPLSKASFEESVDHMVKSGFAGEVENCRGVSASIICGNRPKMGTGMIDLKIDIKQLKHAIPVFRDTTNDGEVIEEIGKLKI